MNSRIRELYSLRFTTLRTRNLANSRTREITKKNFVKFLAKVGFRRRGPFLVNCLARAGIIIIISADYYYYLGAVRRFRVLS